MQFCLSFKGALNCIRKKRIYHGKLIYLPYDGADDAVAPVSSSPPTHSTASVDTATVTGDDLVTTSLKPELLAQAMNKGLGEKDAVSSPEVEHSDESNRESSVTQDVFGVGDVVLEESIGPVNTGVPLKTGEDGHEVENPTESVHKEESSGGRDDSCDHEKGGNEKAPTSETAPIQITSSAPIPVEGGSSQTPPSHIRRYGPSPHLLPDITEATPDNWKVIEGEFLSMTPLMIPHMTSEFFGDPNMSIGTGRIRIMYIRKMSRLGMLGLLTGSSPHTKPEVSYVDVKAYRLEPYTEEGILTIDGESVKYGPVQAQVHEHLARVFCSKRVGQEPASN